MPTMRNAAPLFVVAALSLSLGDAKPTMTPEQAHEQAKAHAINTVSAAMDQAYAQTGIPALFDHKKALGHMLNFKSTLYKHLAPVVSSLNPSSAKRDYESMVSWWCANKNKTALPVDVVPAPRRHPAGKVDEHKGKVGGEGGRRATERGRAGEDGHRGEGHGGGVVQNDGGQRIGHLHSHDRHRRHPREGQEALQEAEWDDAPAAAPHARREARGEGGEGGVKRESHSKLDVPYTAVLAGAVSERADCSNVKNVR